MAVYRAITEGLLSSAHDISEGGMFIACLESAMAGKTGFDICTISGLRNDACLFGEGQSRVVVSISPDKKESFEAFISSNGASATHIGTVTGSGVKVNGENWGSVAEFAVPYNTAIENVIG
jgi:phosphoribosylformylglycinamidine synthase